MYTKEEALAKISVLVEKFSDQLPAYKKADYNEALTRKDFIDPFFEALGWDINNRSGAWEAYREVIHEDKLKIGGVTTAPDYSFRLTGGQRLFFVEAKKPSIVIKDDVAPAYQVRLYGWNAKLALSVVTDFEEFAIYDCSKKPVKTDKASKARLNYFTYKDYIKEFDFFWNTFSKQQVIKGGLVKFQQTDKKGTATVDKAFLENLDEWRKVLAANIYKNNPGISEDELNYAVQQIIDRIIFLRIAEDRALEPYGQLKSSLQNENHYQELYRQFRVADDKYNSGLFHFKKERENNETPDSISGKLSVDNKVIKSIIGSLYPPQCEYLFSVLPVEILGSAYEQFLGKQIVIKGSKAIIEDKPEVRKAGGVYYTPQYIVEYIVEQTLGKLCTDKTPKEVSKIKVVDPACGSGSFLLGAYQYLLNWHINYYAKKPATGKQKEAVLTPEGSLTTAEKKRILLNNLFGVDIDRNAVEVTKLSLLLKCMEGETTASINSQMTFFHERVLPSLEKNIKCGNSLIDLDYYDGEIYFGNEGKIKPFNWQQNFPEIFNIKKALIEDELRQHNKRIIEQAEIAEKQAMQLIEKFQNKAEEPEIDYGELKGFDVVIGNPPYLGGREWKEENGNVYDYFINRYKVAEYQFDMYALFWEVGIKILKRGGLMGFITPNTWLNNQSNKKLRTFILENTRISRIVDYSKIKVFDQATVLPIVTILEKSVQKSITEIYEVKGSELTLKNVVKQEIWKDGELNIINIDLNEKEIVLREKIEKDTIPLERLALVKFGIKIYETGKGNPSQKASFAKDRVFESDYQKDSSYHPYLEGKDVFPYRIDYKNRWLKYGANLAAARDPQLFEGQRILVRRIVGNTLISTFTDKDFVTSQLLQIVKPHQEYISKSLLGILNSKLIAFYFRKKYNRQDKTFPEIRIYELASLPIKGIDINGKFQNEVLAQITQNVDTILQLNEEKHAATSPDKIEQLNQRIAYTDEKINKLVYELYGLSEEEIGIVEGR